MESREKFVARVNREWKTDRRWRGVVRPYRAEDVWQLRGSVVIDHTLARLGSQRLWELLHGRPYVNVLSAVTGNQAVQQVKAGLEAVYVSGWQVAADMNEAGQMYPDQSLYPSDSVPALLRRLNNALLRSDQIHHLEDDSTVQWMAPLVADAEAGFGGPLHAYELMRSMIREGVAGVHFEDQLASVKKCGHLGGKVLVPTREFITKLVAARLAADVSGVDVVLIARTDAHSATLITSDVDPADAEMLTGTRTHEGFYSVRSGVDAAIARGLSYAPYADMLWFETSTPDMTEAERFAKAIHARYPDKLLAYNCSPSFNWRRHLTEAQCATFQQDLGRLGYRFQFVTLSGFHQLNFGMHQLARAYRARGMAAYADLQEREFEAQAAGYEAVKHQRFVGTGYFDTVQAVCSGGNASTLGLGGSTEATQFEVAVKR